jgi:hypothetical protein
LLALFVSTSCVFYHCQTLYNHREFQEQQAQVQPQMDLYQHQLQQEGDQMDYLLPLGVEAQQAQLQEQPQTGSQQLLHQQEQEQEDVLSMLLPYPRFELLLHVIY